VYTASDLQKIRDKVRLSGATENGGEMVDPSSPSGYYKGLMEAVSRISGVQNDLVGLLDGMNTDWEVASSTGRNPVDSLQKYKAGKAYTDITANIKSNLSELQSLRDSMQPPLQQYRNAFDAMNTSVDTLYEYFTAVSTYSGDPPVQAFRASLQKYSSTVDTSLAQIQNAPAPPETSPPASTPPPDSQQQ
jgi:paraquat-inducible protein B